MYDEEEKWKKVLREVGGVTYQTSKSALKGFESVLDLVGRGFSTLHDVHTQALKLATPKKYHDGWVIKGAENIGNKIRGAADYDIVENLYGKPFEQTYKDTWGVSNPVGNFVTSGTGNVLSMLALSGGFQAAGMSGTAASGLATYSTASNRGYQEARDYLKSQTDDEYLSFADKMKAEAYGAMTGGMSALINQISSPGTVAGVTGKEGVKSFSSMLKAAAGEGGENVLENLLTPTLQNIYKPTHVLWGNNNDPDKTILEKMLGRGKELGLEFASGAASSMLMQTTSKVLDRAAEGKPRNPVQLEEEKTKVEQEPEQATEQEKNILKKLVQGEDIEGESNLKMAQDDPGFHELKDPRLSMDGENLRTAGDLEQTANKKLKKEQLKIILKHNPMKDDYHTGIRSVEDIKTFDEAILNDESFVWGDYDLKDAKRDLEKGTITVYSSHEIKQGTFVSTSRKQARDYAGGGEVKQKTIPLEDVAWINGDEGQYAKIRAEDAEARIKVDTEEGYDYTAFREEGIKDNPTSESKVWDTLEKIYKDAGEEDKVNRIKNMSKEDKAKPIVPIEQEKAIANRYIDTIGLEEASRQAFSETNKTDIAFLEQTANRMYAEADTPEAKLKIEQDYNFKRQQMLEASSRAMLLAQPRMDSVLGIIQEVQGRLDAELQNLQRAYAKNPAKKAEIDTKARRLNADQKARIEQRVNQFNEDMASADLMNQNMLRRSLSEDLYAISHERVKTSWGEKARALRDTAKLLNPKTWARNNIGNAVNYGMKKMTAPFERAFQGKYNKLTGLGELTKEDIKHINEEGRKGFIEGIENRKGAYTGKYELGEEGIRRNVFDNEKAGGRALNWLHNLTIKSLSQSDYPAYTASYRGKFAEQMARMNNSTNEKWTKLSAEQKQVMAHVMADEYALRMTYQDDSSWSRSINTAKQKLNNIGDLRTKHGFGVGDLLLLYTQTPANITKTALEYSPLGWIDALKKDIDVRRVLKQDFEGLSNEEVLRLTTVAEEKAGKVIAGALMNAVAFTLGAVGIIDYTEYERGDSREKLEWNKQKKGLSGTTIKVGDKTIALDFLEPFNISTSLGAYTGQKLKKVFTKDGTNEDELEGFLAKAAESQIDSILSQASLSNIKDLFEETMTHKDGMAAGFVSGAINYGSTIPTQFTPTVGKQIGEAIDPYVRQTYSKNPLENMLLGVGAQIPGVRFALPKKKDVFGEDMKNFDAEEPLTMLKHFLNSVVNPSKVRTIITDDDVVDEINRVIETTGDYKILPYVEPSSTSVFDRSKFQELAGKQAYKNYTDLFRTDTYLMASDEEKAELIKRQVVGKSKKVVQDIKEEPEWNDQDRKTMTVTNMFDKIGITQKHYDIAKNSGGTINEQLDAISKLDIGIDEKVILFRYLQPDNKNITDNMLLEAMSNRGMGVDDILHYGKYLGMILDSEPTRYDDEVSDTFFENRYGIDNLDEKNISKQKQTAITDMGISDEMIFNAKNLKKNEEATLDYISKLPISYISRLILLKQVYSTTKMRDVEEEIFQYVASLDASMEEKEEMLYTFNLLR